MDPFLTFVLPPGTTGASPFGNLFGGQQQQQQQQQQAAAGLPGQPGQGDAAAKEITEIKAAYTPGAPTFRYRSDPPEQGRYIPASQKQAWHGWYIWFYARVLACARGGKSTWPTARKEVTSLAPVC
jgi:hypothetical protein